MATKGEGRTGLLFVAPTISLYTIFFWAPLVFIFILSFMKWDIFHPMKFIGLENYKELFSDFYFLKSVVVTLTYSLSTTLLSVILGMMTAILLDRRGVIPSISRVLFFMTAVLPIISVGAIWTWAAGPQSYSALNLLMGFLGMHDQKWLADSRLALLCVIGFTVWRTTGFNALIYTAGLRGISPLYFDAAKIDGASRFHIIKDIIIPQLGPITAFLTITNMISNWNAFTPVWFLTKGGPGSATTVLSVHIYNYGFGRFRFGFASSAAIVLIGIVLVFTYLRLRRT